MEKLDPREFGLNDNASSPAESARVGSRFYAGLFSGPKNEKLFVRILAIFVIVLFACLIFILFFPLRRLSKMGAPRIIYEVYSYQKNDQVFHSVSLNGTDDKVIYTLPGIVSNKIDGKAIYSSGGTATVLDHKDILVDGQNKSVHYIDSVGRLVDQKYKGFDENLSRGYQFPIYSTDGDRAAITQFSDNLVTVQIIDFNTGKIKTYSCGSACVIAGKIFDFSIDAFSPDNTKLYFSADDFNTGPIKYFYLDLADGSFHDAPSNFPAAPSSSEYYTFFPAYDAIFKTSFHTGSLDMTNFSGGTRTRVIDDSLYYFIFNGKDVVYTLAPSSSIADEAITAQGINVQSGERYPVLPPNLVNTWKHNKITPLDFLPQSSTFVYEVEGDNGWEVRLHDLDNKADMTVINLTSGQRPDGSQFFEQYVGIIF